MLFNHLRTKYFLVMMLLIAGITIQIGCLTGKATPKNLSKGSFILYLECNGYYDSRPPYGDVVLLDLNTKQKTQITYDSFWDGRSCFWKSRNSIIFLSKRSNNQYYKHSRGSEPARLYEYNLKTQKITKVPKQTDFLYAKDHRGEKYGSIGNIIVSSYNDSLIAFTSQELSPRVTIANIISGKEVLSFIRPVVSAHGVLTKDYLLMQMFDMGQIIRVNLNSQKIDTIPSTWSSRKMLNVKDAKENTVYFAISDNSLPAIYTYNIATQKYTFFKQFAQGEFDIEYDLSFFNHVFNDSTYLMTDIDKQQHENLFLYHSDSKKREQLTNDAKNKSYIEVLENFR